MADTRGILHESERQGARFALVFFALFMLTFLFLGAVDSLPEPLNMDGSERQNIPSSTVPASGTPTAQIVNALGEMPVRISIPAISLSAKVSNPASTDTTVLDRALLYGAVRYPTSGVLGVDGTVLLFGHSSYLPVVHNQAYKTFDSIQNLKTNDTVSVYSESSEYRYRVVGVRSVNVNEDEQSRVALRQDGQYLVLVTCDSFATKSDRFVVEAEFVGAYPLEN